jgi:cysteine desulfuration protein SufE
MMYYFLVPEESPTVRGFASVMAAGLNGSTPEQVLSVPNDFFQTMGLDKVLTFQRLNGISAILSHMKRLAVVALSKDL